MANFLRNSSPLIFKKNAQVAVPPPAELDGAEEMAQRAVRELTGVEGAEVTPRLLARMRVATWPTPPWDVIYYGGIAAMVLLPPHNEQYYFVLLLFPTGSLPSRRWRWAG